jgi:hypothetical protein
MVSVHWAYNQPALQKRLTTPIVMGWLHFAYSRNCKSFCRAGWFTPCSGSFYTSVQAWGAIVASREILSYDESLAPMTL